MRAISIAVLMAALLVAARARATAIDELAALDRRERPVAELRAAAVRHAQLEGARWWLVVDPSAHARRRAERTRLETEVVRLYYQRRRAQIEWILDPPHDAADEVLRTIEIAELTDLLEALCGEGLPPR